MIKLANETVLLSDRDGTEAAFDAGELENRLRRCFSAAGFGGNGYLAEDIAMAVEFSLHCADEPQRKFNIEELDNVVLSVLHDAGFDEVAKLFQGNNHDTKNCRTEPEEIEHLLQKAVGFGDAKLDELAAQTAAALKKLDLGKVPVALILELARHLAVPAEPSSLVQAAPIDKLYFVPPGGMNSLASGSLKKFFNADVIKFSGVRRTFKAIQLRINLWNFVKLTKLDLPLTELELYPILDELSLAISECINSVRKSYFASTLQNDQELPLCLTISDPDVFVSKALGGSWPESRKALKEIIQYILDCANTPAYRIKFDSPLSETGDLPLK